MERESLQDLSISGIGSAAGGQYRNVQIDGVCKVLADVSAESFRANGQITARGSVQTQKFECNGKLKIEGGLRSDNARIDGLVRVERAVAAEQLYVNGMLTCGEDCTAEKIDVRGCFDIKGLLNADAVGIRMQGKCEAREIGGGSIRVTKSHGSRWAWLLQWAVPRMVSQLEAETIEGDDIELEETVAAVVRGNRVKLGKGCRVDRVEYRDELVVHPQAKVGERIQA